MGYDLHITRAAEWWAENDGCQISEAEWLALVARDPELRLATPADAYYSERMVHWSGVNFEGPWLIWEDGNVYSKNPNALMVGKMVQLAQILEARVQGDDREIYLPEGRVVLDDGTDQRGVDWRTW